MNYPSRQWETWGLSVVLVQVTFLTSESVVLVSTNQKIMTLRNWSMVFGWKTFYPVFFKTDNIKSPGSCFAYGKGAVLKGTLIHGTR
jgi:hypothetical protein